VKEATTAAGDPAPSDVVAVEGGVVDYSETL
jgi:hypothetical protein